MVPPRLYCCKIAAVLYEMQQSLNGSSAILALWEFSNHAFDSVLGQHHSPSTINKIIYVRHCRSGRAVPPFLHKFALSELG